MSQQCPKCQSKSRQNKAGRNPSGSQRYRCMLCGYRHTPQPTEQGYPDMVRLAAVRMYVDGGNLRRIARYLGVSHQSIANWVIEHAAQLPPSPLPDTLTDIEMDELFTFISHKKTRRM